MVWSGVGRKLHSWGYLGSQRARSLGGLLESVRSWARYVRPAFLRCSPCSNFLLASLGGELCDVSSLATCALCETADLSVRLRCGSLVGSWT